MTKYTITVEPQLADECFILKEDGDLERIARDAPTPEGHLAIFDPGTIGLYSYLCVEQGDVLKHVEKLETDQKQYVFPANVVIYIKS